VLERLADWRVLLALISTGVLIRVVLALRLPPTFDIEGCRAAANALQHWGLSAYGALTDFGHSRLPQYEQHLYRYPPGFFPWLLLAAQFPGSQFAAVERLAPIAADVAIAVLVVSELRARDASPATILIAVVLIAFGPLFIAVSAVNGQLDGLAFLFVLLALRTWRRKRGLRRAVIVGSLLGIGASIKTVPIIFVLAFLPSVKDWREGSVLALCAAAVPTASLVPFAISDPTGVRHALAYSGFPGGGGLSLLVEPGLAKHYLSDLRLTTSGAGAWVEAHGLWITLGAVAAASLWLWRFRVPPLEATAVLGITTLLFAANFYEQYLLWLVPFVLACGYVALAAALEAVLLPYLWVTGALPYVGRLSGLGLSAQAAIELSCVVALTALLAASLARYFAVTRSPARAFAAP
jgi:hypothetical protein